jgi:hypothetical protein
MQLMYTTVVVFTGGGRELGLASPGQSRSRMSAVGHKRPCTPFPEVRSSGGFRSVSVDARPYCGHRVKLTQTCF